MSKNKRPQAPKVGTFALNAAMQEKRRSSAASPHRNKSRYSRTVKHKGKGWE